MVKIDGLLDKETGEAVLTALDAAMTPEARADAPPGTFGQLRSDAPLRSVTYMHPFLDHHSGGIGGQRPHVSVIVDLDTLLDRGGRRCESPARHHHPRDRPAHPL